MIATLEEFCDDQPRHVPRIETERIGGMPEMIASSAASAGHYLDKTKSHIALTENHEIAGQDVTNSSIFAPAPTKTQFPRIS